MNKAEMRRNAHAEAEMILRTYLKDSTENRVEMELERKLTKKEQELLNEVAEQIICSMADKSL